MALYNPTVQAEESAAGEQLISSTVVDLNVSTKQTLYTVPAGKSLIVTKIVYRNSTISTAEAGVNFSLGYNASANTVVSSVLIDNLGLNTASKYSVPPPTAEDTSGGVLMIGAVIGTEGQVLGFKLSAAIAAGNLTVDVWGYLI